MRAEKNPLTNFRHIITRIILYFARRKFESGGINLPDDLKMVTSLLICLPPDQRELTMIKNLLPQINRTFAGAKICLLASPGSMIYNIFPRRGFHIMTPGNKELSWGGMASKEYLRKLKEEKFEMIFDMNLETNYFAQGILLAFPDAVRVGPANRLERPYYNLEIKTRFLRDEKNIYKSMVETIDRLINPETEPEEETVDETES